MKKGIPQRMQMWYIKSKERLDGGNMENLILSFNVVLPLFLSIALGYALRCLHMLEETTQTLLA